MFTNESTNQPLNQQTWWIAILYLLAELVIIRIRIGVKVETYFSYDKFNPHLFVLSRILLFRFCSLSIYMK